MFNLLTYLLAVLCSLEYWIECLIFGQWKFNSTSIGLGLGFLVGGQVIRSVAMWTCGDSFSHVIKDQNADGKKLVTHGIYSYLRHPSYFGWFYWSIGTQLLLCNPICCVFYTYASWKFFAQRIPYEEDLLVEFYGNEYIEYAHKTIIGIPFVSTTYSNDFFRCFGGPKSHNT